MAGFFSILGAMFGSSPKSKGKMGELKTSFLLSMGTNAKNFVQFDDITLHTPDNATTQIDHILIGKTGIFVIETKNYEGWIYGDENQYQWTQVSEKRNKNQFYNPLLQNKKHAKIVTDLLQVEAEQVVSLVVFMGKATFKTPMPNNVIYLIDLNKTLRGYQTEIFTDKQVERFCLRLRNRKLDTGALADKVHLANIDKKRQEREMKQEQKNLKQTEISTDTMRCPKCQSSMVKRVTKQGQNVGKEFWGCSQFPKCRGIVTINS